METREFPGSVVMTYSKSRANYAATLSAVVEDREPVIIIRAKHEPVIIFSLDDYQSLKETTYLLRSPENAPTLTRFNRAP